MSTSPNRDSATANESIIKIATVDEDAAGTDDASDATTTPSGSTSPRGSNVSLSDPFQDEDFVLTETSPPSRLHRRSASVPRGRPSRGTAEGPGAAWSADASYLRRLMEELEMDPASARVVPDNAVLHASAWRRESVLLPHLHEYHPMDDYMVYLLRRERIHARNVSLLSDNPKTHMSRRSFRSLMTRNKGKDAAERGEIAVKGEGGDHSESSLNVEGLAEYLATGILDDGSAPGEAYSGSLDYEGVLSIARLPAFPRRVINVGSGLSKSSLVSDDTAQETTFPRECYESQDISNLVLSPMKEESPNSVMDVAVGSGSGSSSTHETDRKKTKIRNIDTETLGLKTEDRL
jgi:hypothetical protein